MLFCLKRSIFESKILGKEQMDVIPHIDIIDKYYKKFYRASKMSGYPSDSVLIKSAYKFTVALLNKAEAKTRAEDIMQALEVATVITEDVGLGTRSVVCTLLFPMYRNRDLTHDNAHALFGEHMAIMLTGLKKIYDIETLGTGNQTENLRKLILTLASDIRVIIIRLAYELQVMRELQKINEDEQVKTAAITLNIYAPLAHRLGLYNIKSEMEDLSMKYLEPDKYKMIVQKLKESAAERNRFIKDFVAPIEEELKKQQFSFEIKGRPKSIYSIWTKMHKQNVDFEEVYDKFAIRIILDSKTKNEKADCWRVYSIVTDAYQPNPKRLRDWISVPKSNGYESLHTTVVVPGGKWVEVQIRTIRMNEIAEKGLAAHWKYKGGKEEVGLDLWLTRVREVLEASEKESVEFTEDIKLSLYNKEIFVFTPKGDLKQYPAGATVLDFAFDIHSDVGSACVGAKINGRNVPIRHELSNGDKVEIITSKNQSPKQDWIDFVVTSKAKTKIKQTLNEAIFREAENGRETVKRRFRNWKIPFVDVNINKLLKHYKLKTALDLYYQVATEKIDLGEIKEFLKTEEKAAEIKPEELLSDNGELIEKDLTPETEKHDDYLIIDEKIANVDYKLAKCCTPIYGDKIFGFVSVTEGIKIHRVNCPNAHDLITRYGYRIVRARWSTPEKTTQYQAMIKITGVDDIGIINRLTDVISKDLKVNMRSLTMDSNDGMFEGLIKIFVKDTRHLEKLTDRILRVKGVLSASRMDAG